MTPLLLHLLLGATVFLEQEIPGLRYSGAEPLTGTVEPNYRQVDLDRDGHLDLVFTDHVLFQRDGLYPAGSSAALPEEARGGVCDTGKHSLYVRHHNRLRQFAWDGEAWEVLLDQEIEWRDLFPEPADAESNDESGAEPVAFSRFLVDIDQDDVPEINVYARDGVHIYRRTKDLFRPDGIVDLYPQVAATPSTGSPIWPRDRRSLAAPGQRLELMAIWRGTALTVVSRQDLRTGQVRYRSRSVDLAEDSPESGITDQRYPLMDAAMRPLHLNADDALDFAGGVAVSSGVLAFSEPMYDTLVSTDGGETVRRFRTKAFSPGSGFVDIEGDGDLDLFVHETQITSGGLRESLNRFFFQHTVRHLVSFYRQNETGAFEYAPRLTVDLILQLDKVPYQEGSLFRRYRSGDLIDVSGDFNGDGKKDLLVQESSESLAIYLSRGYRYSKHPIYYLSVQKNERFYVADVDGNGMSDVVLIRPGTDRSGGRSRVYFSRQTGS